MEVKDLLSTIPEKIAGSANVKAVYGEPITAQGKTIIPVARIGYGFGGGGGTGSAGPGGPQSSGEGGGGGGGGMVMPVGVVEITPTCTRFIPFIDRRRLAAAMMLGLTLGMWIGRRRQRRRWR